MCHWAIHKKIPLAIQKSWMSLQVPPIFLQGQNWWKAILKSSEMPGACVPGIPKKCHNLIDELTDENYFSPLNYFGHRRNWPTWILAEPVWTETQATKEQRRIKTPWSMSSTDPKHVLTWDRLSGEKMVVLLAVKEELAWQQSDTDRQMIPINLCSKVKSLFCMSRRRLFEFAVTTLTLQEFWTTILWFNHYAFHDVLSRQIATQDGRVLRYATDLLRDDEVVAYAAVAQRLCCDQRVRSVMLCRHNVFVKLVQ